MITSKNNDDTEHDVMEIDNEEQANIGHGDKSSASGPPFVSSPNLLFLLGSRVQIKGLVHQPKLNSHLAIVEEYLWDQGRYKIRPLGRSAKRLTKSKFLAVRGEHLHLVEPSSFFAKLTSRAGIMLRGFFYCNIVWDQEQQLSIKITYQDDFLDEPSPNNKGNTIASREELNCMSCVENPNVFDILNTPIDYEEYLTEDQFLNGDEVLILYPKPVICDLYEAMLEYELLEELDMTAHVGLHGDINLCQLRFPYSLPGLKEPPNSDQPVNDDPPVGVEDEFSSKRQKQVKDGPATGALDEESSDLVEEISSSASAGTKKRQFTIQ